MFSSELPGFGIGVRNPPSEEKRSRRGTIGPPSRGQFEGCAAARDSVTLWRGQFQTGSCGLCAKQEIACVSMSLRARSQTKLCDSCRAKQFTAINCCVSEIDRAYFIVLLFLSICGNCGLAQQDRASALLPLTESVSAPCHQPSSGDWWFLFRLGSAAPRE